MLKNGSGLNRHMHAPFWSPFCGPFGKHGCYLTPTPKTHTQTKTHTQRGPGDSGRVRPPPWPQPRRALAASRRSGEWRRTYGPKEKGARFKMFQTGNQATQGESKGKATGETKGNQRESQGRNQRGKPKKDREKSPV